MAILHRFYCIAIERGLSYKDFSIEKTIVIGHCLYYMGHVMREPDFGAVE